MGCLWNIKIETYLFMVLCGHIMFESYSHTWNSGWTPGTQTQSYSYEWKRVWTQNVSLLSCWVVCFTLFCSNMFKPWDKEPPLARQCLALGGSNLWQLFPDCNGPHGLFFVARHWRFLQSNMLNVCFNETHFAKFCRAHVQTAKLEW